MSKRSRMPPRPSTPSPRRRFLRRVAKIVWRGKRRLRNLAACVNASVYIRRPRQGSDRGSWPRHDPARQVLADSLACVGVRILLLSRGIAKGWATLRQAVGCRISAVDVLSRELLRVRFPRGSAARRPYRERNPMVGPRLALPVDNRTMPVVANPRAARHAKFA